MTSFLFRNCQQQEEEAGRPVRTRVGQILSPNFKSKLNGFFDLVFVVIGGVDE